MPPRHFEGILQQVTRTVQEHVLFCCYSQQTRHELCGSCSSGNAPHTQENAVSPQQRKMMYCLHVSYLGQCRVPAGLAKLTTRGVLDLTRQGGSRPAEFEDNTVVPHQTHGHKYPWSIRNRGPGAVGAGPWPGLACTRGLCPATASQRPQGIAGASVQAPPLRPPLRRGS